jgi:hypothetical protein
VITFSTQGAKECSVSAFKARYSRTKRTAFFREIRYSNQNKQNKRLVNKTVVSLNKLDRVLLALVLHEMTSLLVGEVSHELNAVDGAIIHALMSFTIIYN